MWGMDAHGLRTLNDEEVNDLIHAQCFVLCEREFTFADLFLAIWPNTDKKDKQTGKLKPNSLTNLKQQAKNGALKWGNLKIEPEELNDTQWTNQDFCVISNGKKNREMVIFTD